MQEIRKEMGIVRWLRMRGVQKEEVSLLVRRIVKVTFLSCDL